MDTSARASTSGGDPIACESVLARVAVHARGALITREVTLPDDLPRGVVDVAVGGITTSARAGSVRAALSGGERTVSAVHTALVLPGGAPRPGPALERVRDLAARLERVDDEHRVLQERRARLGDLSLSPRVRTLDERKRERDAFDARFGDALSMATLLDETVVALGERLAQLEQARRELARELEAARLEAAQTSTPERRGHDRPTRTITVRLVGSGRPGKLVVTYAVAAARWWPAYTLRIDGGGARGTWIFDAVVAQDTGEDWTQVALSLSSADLVFDARMPELASLRFGRAQPARRRPFRPPPRGVDEMFAAYLAFGGGAFGGPPSASAAVRGAPPRAEPEPEHEDEDEDEERDDEVDTMVMANTLFEARTVPPPAPQEKTFARAGAAPAPPPRLARAPAPSAVMSRRRSAPAAPGGAPSEELHDEPEIAPSDAWRDHDALVLANADDPRRGRLVPRPDPVSAALERGAAPIDGPPGERYRDPAESRGMFDHRYDATGRADVPSDGRVHRVAVTSRPCEVKLAWRAVPSEAPEVYREAHVLNPFDTALLGAPVDVYLDGSLLTTTSVDRIERGGTLFCGMGADDRVKVARNVRVDEESAGLLGGATAVTHTVSIDLSSTWKQPVTVTVLERVPVTDDKALEVKVVRASPRPEAYDQADRGAPVRGGQRFDVSVPPGDKARVELVYRLVFSQKLDVVGGSRRD